MAKTRTIRAKTRKKKAPIKKSAEPERGYYGAGNDDQGKSHPYRFPSVAEAAVSVARKKAERISLRVSEVHKKTITEASELAGFKNVNDYIIHISLSDSQRVVRDHKILTLTGEDSIKFLDALHQPQMINENLQRAMDEFVAEQEK